MLLDVLPAQQEYEHTHRGLVDGHQWGVQDLNTVPVSSTLQVSSGSP